MKPRLAPFAFRLFVFGCCLVSAIVPSTYASDKTLLDRIENVTLREYFPHSAYLSVAEQQDCTPLFVQSASYPFEFCQETQANPDVASVDVQVDQQGNVRLTLNSSEAVRRFFMPEFLKLWKQSGMDPREAAHQALENSKNTVLQIRNTAVAEPTGSIHDEAPLSDSLTPILSETIETLIPGSAQHLEPTQARLSIEDLKELLSGSIWDYWKDALDPNRKGKNQDTITLDGETVRYLLGSFQSWLGSPFDTVVDRIDAIEIIRDSKESRLLLQSDMGYRLDIQQKSKTKKFGLYAVEVPKTVEFRVKAKETTITLNAAPDRAYQPIFWVNVPVLKDTIILKGGKINLADGKFSAEARAGGLVTAVVEGRLFAHEFKGVNLFKSIWASFLDIFRKH